MKKLVFSLALASAAMFGAQNAHAQTWGSTGSVSLSGRIYSHAEIDQTTVKPLAFMNLVPGQAKTVNSGGSGVGILNVRWNDGATFVVDAPSHLVLLVDGQPVATPTAAQMIPLSITCAKVKNFATFDCAAGLAVTSADGTMQEDQIKFYGTVTPEYSHVRGQYVGTINVTATVTGG